MDLSDRLLKETGSLFWEVTFSGSTIAPRRYLVQAATKIAAEEEALRQAQKELGGKYLRAIEDTEVRERK